MKVVLLSNITKLGNRWEVREVSDGYARNVLIPQGLAEPATKIAMIRANVAQQKKEKIAEESLKKVQQLASAIDGYELTIRARANENTELYASIQARQISDALVKEGYNVPTKFIKLPEPIKKLGEYTLNLVLDHGLETQIKVIVEIEKEPEN